MISRLWREAPRGDRLSDPGGVEVHSKGRLPPLEFTSKYPKGPEPCRGGRTSAPSGWDFHPQTHAQGRFAPGYSLPPLRGEIRLEL
jgi:hypothetical protein